jgi:hypothetical protein
LDLDPVRLPLEITIHPAQIPAKLSRISKREELDPGFMVKYLQLLSGPEAELLGHGWGITTSYCAETTTLSIRASLSEYH